MLQKWKFILTNWINCYTIASSQTEQNVTTESLLTIISHLRKNISLDESKSSTLEAQTIKEFIVEKYPEFKFENGTSEASSEEELYMAASLLLYFVCVNSKNVDVKSAMCSQLSTEDQETILKFSQYLMQCSKIKYMDVLGAITEACGLEVASGEHMSSISVAETPPVLRSLHGEVRRLRAALDAERFDRTYLQDELASTAARIEMLLKEKEQYKLEIVNLKGKISLCCGSEAEARGGDAAAEMASKFARQIEDLELRLLTVQEKLDDVVYERDTYKAKVQELKQERDKWVAASQEEATRAEQLVEQLDTERQHAVSLRELLAELQQHQRKTCLDSSQLECDDPDASMRSLHNVSISSEACANVIEVQLSEERAKVVVLKTQIQELQVQLDDLNQKAENEKLSLQSIIAKKDYDIFNLKHRINEEIEEKQNLQAHFNDQCTRLNNEINELEQRLKDTSESFQQALEQKMEEIKTLQEEKLSILETLTNETNKFDNFIKELKIELEAEKASKHKLKENYENQVMKLNEKVLNRNNELVELQNNVSQNSEMIEQLHLELRNEKEMKEQLANKYHQDIAHLTHERKAVEINLNKSIDEAKELQKRLLQNVAVFEELNKEIDDLKLSNTKTLQELDEKNATINTIKMQLQDEIHYKTHLQNELIQLQQHKTDLTNELHSVKNELHQLKIDFVEKDKIIYALDLHLIEAKQAKDNLMEDYRSKIQEAEKLLQDLDAKERELTCTRREFEHEKKVFNEELRKRDNTISDTIEKLEAEICEKNSIQEEMASLKTNAESLSKELEKKCQEINMMKTEYDKYVEVAEKNSKLIETLESRLEAENQRYVELQKTFDSQTSTLLAKLNETDKAIKDHNNKYKNAMEKKELQLQTWRLEVEKMQKIVDSDVELTRKIEKEKDALALKLGEEILFREKLEKEYQNQCTILQDVTSRLNSEVASKNKEIIALKQEIQKLVKKIEDDGKEMAALKENLSLEKAHYEELVSQINADIDILQKKVNEYVEIESDLKNEINCKIDVIGNLQKENERVRISLEELKVKESDLRMLVNEKLNIIEILQNNVQCLNSRLELSQKENSESKSAWEQCEAEFQEKLAEKEDLILKLKYLIEELKENLDDVKRQVEDISKEKAELELKTSEQIQELLDQVSQIEGKLAESEDIGSSLKQELSREKADRDALETEKSEMAIEKETLLRELDQEQVRVNALNEETNNLLHEKSILSQAIVEERNLRQILEQECQNLKLEKENVLRKLNDEIQAKEALLSDKEYISQLLNDEIEVKTNLFERLNNEIEEKEKIKVENSTLSQQLQVEIKSKVSLLEEKEQIAYLLNKEIEQKTSLSKENENLNEELLSTVAILEEKQQKLQEELSSKESIFLLEKEVLTQQLDEFTTLNEVITQEKENLRQKLSEEIANKNQVLQEKQNLIQELGEEKTAKILALQEKEAISSAKSTLEDEFKAKNEFTNTLIREKNDLLQEYNELYSRYTEELASKEALYEDKDKLAQLLEKQTEINTSLDDNLLDYKAIQDAVLSDKELLSVEKEDLVKILGTEKAAKDELETEKNVTTELLCEFKQKVERELNEKQQEIDIISEELKHLEADLRKHEDLSVQVASLVNSNLSSLLENMKNIEVPTDVLDSLMKIQTDTDFSMSEWCSTLFDTVNILTTNIMSRRNTEMSLQEENSMLKGVKEELQEKVNELLSNMAALEENLEKSKAELSILIEARKQDELKNTTEIQMLRNENQALTNQLNDLTFQLETKVHSFKEKLVDSENNTEKLKKSYEMQIDNLNLMVEKLTAFMKDKTVEIEAVRADNEKLQETIDNSVKELSTLAEARKQDELKTTTEIQLLRNENQALTNQLNDVKFQLETKVHSFKEKLVDSENNTEKLKQSYEIQIDNLKVMVEKLTAYMKEKTVEVEALRADKKKLKETIQNSVKELSILAEIQIQDEMKNTSEIQMLQNENEALKKTYEIQIDNFNVMVEKLTAYMKEKTDEIEALRTDNEKLQEIIDNSVKELSSLAEARKQDELKNTTEIQMLRNENQALTNQLNDVKFQLETKVHSFKEKLVDSENNTEKLKKSYEMQIDNLNLMVEKLTAFMKDKTAEIETLRADNEKLQETIDNSVKVIQILEEEANIQKNDNEKLLSEFESERLVMKNMVSVTESVMEDQKTEFNKALCEVKKDLQLLQEENDVLQKQLETERLISEATIKEKDAALDKLFKQISELKEEVDHMEMNLKKDNVFKEELVTTKQHLNEKIKQLEELQTEILKLKQELHDKETQIECMEAQTSVLHAAVKKYRDDVTTLQDKETELETMTDFLTHELLNELDQLSKAVNDDTTQDYRTKLKETIQAKTESKFDIIGKIKSLNSIILMLFKESVQIEKERRENGMNLEKLRADVQKLSTENELLCDKIEEREREFDAIQQNMKQEYDEIKKMCESAAHEKLNLENKCSLLQEYQTKAEKELQDREREINSLKENAVRHAEGELERLHIKLKQYEQLLQQKSEIIKKIEEDKESIKRELEKEWKLREKCEAELQDKLATYCELREKFAEIKTETGILRKENDEMLKTVSHRDTFGGAVHEKMNEKAWSVGEEHRHRHQVSTPTSDLTHSSMDSNKTISDLEKIIYDKNRTITTLQSDITYLKSLIAESENKLLDVTKELDLSKENCQQLSSQLKKIVHQKNEEIAELKKQVNKMSVTETRASQIIKLSTKYQAMILKRIAEIKSNTVLKELTNFGNTTTDNELRRSLTAGGITMEELESFLETTDRHLRRCAEKQLALQKERDRLTEVNKINESEILNLKKFLTELSLSFKTFSSVKEIYTQKMSKIVSVQRTVRREILSLEGTITDAAMTKLERSFAAIMQDLSECSMNLERWVERSISRTISPEKIKQAFTSDSERSSLATTTFQNTSLEVQLDELENSFHKLLEEIARAQVGEGAKDTQAVTVMEVRAEYEDKLNRMKAKMKQLYQEQIGVFKEKQREEIMALERELQKTRDKFAESSEVYEAHIKALTTELWNVGEKFLMKKEEAEWLRKQRSGSLMSLQHVHSGGLHAHNVDTSRQSDTHSLRSLPVAVKNEKRGGRGLHMSDEEGEVFDNRCLKELATTPRRDTLASGQRLSELKWRNSLCPPHLKSSYPAETQFVNTLDEEDLKCTANGGGAGKGQRKEVGITAYKKPGPPTPSKQAGRLSATDSELRESLRCETEAPARKTSTPSRLRALFRSNRHDTAEGTPRSRRLSNIFRKK